MSGGGRGRGNVRVVDGSNSLRRLRRQRSSTGRTLRESAGSDACGGRDGDGGVAGSYCEGGGGLRVRSEMRGRERKEMAKEKKKVGKSVRR
jgi:hypothetical protein